MTPIGIISKLVRLKSSPSTQSQTDKNQKPELYLIHQHVFQAHVKLQHLFYYYHLLLTYNILSDLLTGLDGWMDGWMIVISPGPDQFILHHSSSQ